MRSFRLEDQTDLRTIDEYCKSLEELHKNLGFHSKQQEVIDAIFKHGKKRVFIRKGRKGGGTQTLMYPMIRIAKCFPRSACYIIGPQLKLEKEIVWKNGRLHSMIPKEWGVTFMDSECRAVFPNGSFIKVEGADNHNSMVGIEGDAFAFDEGKDHDPRAYKNCYPNLASRDALWIFGGAPPESRHNFYYELEQEAEKDPDWFTIHWTIWDNPFLPGGKEWVEKEKAKYYARGDWDEWENLYEARYVFGGKRTVIPSFRQENHVAPLDFIMERLSKDKHKLRWYTMCDPGFATCFAVMFACINPYTSEVFILNEIYETNRENLSVKAIWPRIREIEGKLYPGGPWKRVYDSAAPGFPQEVRAQWPHERLGFRPTYKELGDETKFFRIINSIFHTNKCYVSEECRKTVWEIVNYVTRPPKDILIVSGKEASIYPDENNHQLDNFRYLLKLDNYRFIEAPPDVKVVKLDNYRKQTLEEAIAEARGPKKDWASAIMEQDFSDDIFDDNFDLMN